MATRKVLTITTLSAEAEVGDLVLAFKPYDPSMMTVAGERSVLITIEEVTQEIGATEIISRWLDQHIITRADQVEIWEAMAGFYYRRRGPLG